MLIPRILCTTFTFLLLTLPVAADKPHPRFDGGPSRPGCPMRAGQPCDETCMKVCAAKGGCGLRAKDRLAERVAIVATALDYAEGWYAGDAARMARALHPKLAKRMVYIDGKTGVSVLHEMDRDKLVAGTAAGGGKKVPPGQQKKAVTILDLYGNAATVKLVMDGWVDYLHIAKFDGRWVIVNVLWEREPKPPGAASSPEG